MGSLVTGVSNFRAAMLGVAYGDGWGYPNERLSYDVLTMMDLRGPDLPRRLIVSDDTQLTLHLAQAQGLTVTDEASAMEAQGLAPLLVTGSAQNFKVTYPQDFRLAQAVLSSRQTPPQDANA